jgi:ribokinase
MDQDVRIVVVGSFAVGLTMKLARFPMAGETQLGSGYRMDHGGKGSNQAVGCARLGAQVSFVASIGQDAAGEMALELYRNEGVAARLQRAADQPTGVGFILVKADTGENCIALDPGANDLLSAAHVAANDDAFAAARVALTQLEIPVEAAQAAMEHGRAHGAITILNPAPARAVPDTLLQNTDILTPNQSEAKVLLGYSPDAEVATARLGRELLARGPKQVVVTLGEHGAFIATPEFEKHVPAISVAPVDTTGAGDAFNAGLAVASACGVGLEAAVRFAVVAGGLAVTKAGVVPALPRQDDVLQFHRQSGSPIPDGVLDLWSTCR